MSSLVEVPLNWLPESAPFVSSLPLNASARIVAGVFAAEKGITVDRVYLSHVSTTGTSPTYRASLQALNASGQPDGTVLGGGSPASATFNPTSLGWSAASMNEVLLSNSFNISNGINYAVVVDYSSGTIDGSNFSTFGYYTAPLSGLPYAIDYQASWNKRANRPLFAYGNSSMICGTPMATASNQNYTSSGTNEYGMGFTLPASMGSTYKLYGVDVLYSPPTSTGTYAIKLYSGSGASDTTAIQSSTGRVGLVTGATNRPHRLIFSGTLATLNFGSPYRFSITAETANTNTLYYLTLPNAASRFANTAADDVYWTERGGGNWTDSQLKLAYIRLLIGDITGGSSGGGMLHMGGVGQTGVGVF